MEYKQFMQTSGRYKGQDMTFVDFAKDEAEHMKYFREIMRALCYIDPSLVLIDFGTSSLSVNRFISPDELTELTNGCPDIHYQTRKKTGLTVNSKYL